MNKLFSHIAAVLRIYIIPAALILVCVFSGCGRSVKFTVSSTNELNWYHDSSHTIQLRIFQVKDRKDFDLPWNKYLTESFDKSKILGDYEEYLVYPEQTLRIKIKKLSEAQYFGIVAGFYKPSGVPPRAKVIQEIPGRFSTVKIRLGKQSIEDVHVE